MAKNIPLISQKEIAIRFHSFRVRANLTFEQVASQCQVTLNQLYALERGEWDQEEAKVLVRLARAYNVQVADFFNPYTLCTDIRRILALYREAEISEGYAAHLLQCDRLDLRYLADPEQILVILDSSLIRDDPARAAVESLLLAEAPTTRQSIGQYITYQYSSTIDAVVFVAALNGRADKECAFVQFPRNRRLVPEYYACLECEYSYSPVDFVAAHKRSLPGCGHAWKYYGPIERWQTMTTVWRVVVDMTNPIAPPHVETIGQILTNENIQPVLVAYQKLYARYWTEAKAREVAIGVNVILADEPVATVEEVDA